MSKKSANEGVNERLTDREHFHTRPSMYIGSVITTELDTVVLNKNSELQKSKYCINAGKVQLFIEAISNCADNHVKNGTIKALEKEVGKSDKSKLREICASHDACIHVEITPEYMSVKNGGSPFDISPMAGGDVLIPESCFLETKVGSNFRDEKTPRFGSGRNGYGAKTITYFSKKLEVVSMDETRKRGFRMTIQNNGDLETKKICVHPEPMIDQNGKMSMPQEVSSSYPIDFETYSTGKSYTLVKWTPDYEEGPISQESLKAFCTNLPKTATLILRRTISNVSEEYTCTYRKDRNSGTVTIGNETVNILSVTNLVYVSYPEGNVKIPGTCIFRGSSSIIDDEIDFCARYCMDLTLCGIPINLTRTWADGSTKNELLLPKTVEEYGKLMFPDATNFVTNWVSDDKKVRCAIAYFDTPGHGIQMGLVNGLWADAGIHMTAANTAVFAKIKAHPETIKIVGERKFTVNEFKDNVSVVVSCIGLNPQQEGQTKSGLSAISGKKSLHITSITDKQIDLMCGEKTRWSALSVLYAAQKGKELAVLIDGISKKKVEGFVPANEEGPDATLIVTEGDSCKPYGMMFKNLVKKHIGVFPMRGKPSNVSESEEAVLYSNRKFALLVKVMGFRPGYTYVTQEEKATLRYGRILFMGDPDLDGFHIISLMIANVKKHWPFLFKERRIGVFKTPVIRICGNSRKTKDTIYARYYSDQEYLDKKAAGQVPDGAFKRIKGLGSINPGKGSTPSAEIMDDMDHASVMWFDMTPEGADAIDMFFSKDRANDRKNWITTHAATCNSVPLDSAPNDDCNMFQLGSAPLLRMDVLKYVQGELTQYSVSSLRRAIPGMDGLKDVQRKILAYILEHTNFGESSKIHKVSDLAGAISEKQCYHHGPDSMVDAIKRLAITDFVGANNCSVLEPDSNVGSKYNWPKDGAAGRYAFISAAGWLQYAIHKEIYESIPKILSDFTAVEPERIPCDIPIGIVNGFVGIATGWASYIPPCHPTAVIKWLIERTSSQIEGRSPKQVKIPYWYRGFKGTVKILTDAKDVEKIVDVDASDDESYEHAITNGKAICATGVFSFEKLPKGKGQTTGYFYITEVPPETRLDALHQLITDLQDEKIITTTNYSMKNGMDYKLGLSKSGLEMAENGTLEARLKLSVKYPLSNIFFLDSNGSPVRFDDVYAYMETFYQLTIADYERGKSIKLQDLQSRCEAVEAKIKYINLIIDKKIVIGESSEAHIIGLLEKNKIPVECTTMSGPSLSKTAVEKLKKKLQELNADVEKLRATTPYEMYLNNLKTLKKHLPTCPMPTCRGSVWTSAEK